MYQKLGNYPVILAAHLLDLQSDANRTGRGNARTGSSPALLVKRAGQIAWRDGGSGALSMVFATGGKSSDEWKLADGGSTYTPVNLGAFTVGGDSTYSNGLLTTDGGNDAAGRATQSMTLSAGTYFLSGTAAFEGSAGNHVTPRIRVGTSATNGNLLTKILGRTKGHPTAAESATEKEAFGVLFTVATEATIHFTIDLVDEADALSAGSAYLTLNPIEAQ